QAGIQLWVTAVAGTSGIRIFCRECLRLRRVCRRVDVEERIHRLGGPMDELQSGGQASAIDRFKIKFLDWSAMWGRPRRWSHYPTRLIEIWFARTAGGRIEFLGGTGEGCGNPKSNFTVGYSRDTCRRLVSGLRNHWRNRNTGGGRTRFTSRKRPE